MNNSGIMLASNDRNLVVAFSKWCKRLGKDVAVVSSDQDIVQAVQEEQPDLLCVDLEEFDLVTIGEELSASSITSNVPVIFLRHHTGASTSTGNLCAYHLPKTRDLCRRIVPVIEELIDVSLASDMC